MNLIPTTESSGRTVLDDAAIVDLFTDAGITVEVVAHCDDASCPVCFGWSPAKAA